MAKPAVKDILLQKGEKIAIGIGVGLLGLLLVLGLLNVVSAESPVRKATAFESEANRIQQQVNSPGEPAPPLPEWVIGYKRGKNIDAEAYVATDPTFEPVYTPDLKHENPRVL